MTPEDFPGDVVTSEALLPWLSAIVPAQEPVCQLGRVADTNPEPVELPDAA